MTINWKVRFRNRVWLTGFLSAIVSFAFTLLELLDIVPALTEETLMQALQAVLLVLSGLGVLVDPTTQGISDSPRALSYQEPGQ